MPKPLPFVAHCLGALLLLSPCFGQERVPVPVAAKAAPAPSGIQADGTTDNTQAIQKALDDAGKTGGVVHLPAGKILVSGSLTIPPGVSLVGVQTAPVYIEPLIGTVILATGGRDKEEDPALFELGNSSVVQGLTVYYPEQKPDDIHPYSWTFHLQGGDNTVENVTLINSYNGIRIGPEVNVRHRIRSVSGCVLRRGIWLDRTTDIGRIENVQWHCHWWSSPKVGGSWDKVFEYMWKNCEGFIFGRTDWEYVTNTFIFPANIGYRFIATPNGADERTALGDRCRRDATLYCRGPDSAHGTVDHQRTVRGFQRRRSDRDCHPANLHRLGAAAELCLLGPGDAERGVARQGIFIAEQLLFQQWTARANRSSTD